MVERFVYVRLKDEFQNTAGRAEVIERTLSDLDGLPGLLSIRAGSPADEHATKAWDIVIAVQFASLDDVKPYLSHPKHRAYVDEFLVPRMDVIRYWNFEMAGRSQS